MAAIMPTEGAWGNDPPCPMSRTMGRATATPSTKIFLSCANPLRSFFRVFPIVFFVCL